MIKVERLLIEQISLDIITNIEVNKTLKTNTNKVKRRLKIKVNFVLKFI